MNFHHLFHHFCNSIPINQRIKNIQRGVLRQSGSESAEKNGLLEVENKMCEIRRSI